MKKKRKVRTRQRHFVFHPQQHYKPALNACIFFAYFFIEEE